jgi:hypothetical protein
MDLMQSLGPSLMVVTRSHRFIMRPQSSEVFFSLVIFSAKGHGIHCQMHTFVKQNGNVLQTQ